MLNLTNILPSISKYKTMKIFGAGYSIRKYWRENVCDDSSFYVILSHYDVFPDIEKKTDAPILFFAHDYHTGFFDPIVKKQAFRSFLSRDNVYCLLHNRQINHEDVWMETNYPEDRISWIKNLYFYEKAQSNIKYFENSSNTLLGFSSTLHSPLSLVIGNDFISEVHLYGLDLYIYHDTNQFNQGHVGSAAPLIFNANKLLLNYIKAHRPQVKLSFFN